MIPGVMGCTDPHEPKPADLVMQQACPGRQDGHGRSGALGIEMPLSPRSPPVSIPDSQPPFLVFGAPRIEEAEIAEVEACLRSGWLGTGPRVAQFEHDFAAWRQVSPSRAAAV